MEMYFIPFLTLTSIADVKKVLPSKTFIPNISTLY